MTNHITLYIFNPEHDLCLANGDPNYVPPQSAVDFARRGVDVMKIIYGDEAVVIAADDYAEWRNASVDVVVDRIVPWGWDARLKRVLMKQGVDNALLPSDRYIDALRNLQHRTSILSLQPTAFSVCSSDEVKRLLADHKRLVLKAPWSGSGRGLRWVDGALTPLDEAWISKTVATQRCVIAEVRNEVVENFAFEYLIDNSVVRTVGLSLFVTQSGVYRNNLLLPDYAIRERIGIPHELEVSLHHWLLLNIAPYYNGFLGIDLYKTTSGHLVVSELNLRHTMGLAAHSYLLHHPEMEGSTWTPEVKNDTSEKELDNF